MLEILTFLRVNNDDNSHLGEFSSVQKFSSVYFNHKNSTKETCKSNMNQIKMLLCYVHYIMMKIY